MLTSLKGRSVIVTGGSKGIGKGIARVFARQGAHVLIAARDEEALEAAAEELAPDARGRVETGLGRRVRGGRCRRVAEAAVERFGAIDVLCANAGIFPDKPLVELTEADVDVLGVNLKGTMFSVQACIPALAASGHGRVVADARRSPARSPAIRAGRTTAPARPPSSASCKTAAIELAPRRITVNAVMPGTSPPRGWTTWVRTTSGAWRPPSRSIVSARSTTSATPPCSSPATRRLASPARPSWSTAVRSCPSPPAALEGI